MIGGSGDESRDLGTFGLRPKDRQIGVQISVATLGSSQVPLTMARNIQEGRRAFESPRSPTFCFTKSGVDKGQSHLSEEPHFILFRNLIERNPNVKSITSISCAVWLGRCNRL